MYPTVRALAASFLVFLFLGSFIAVEAGGLFEAPDLLYTTTTAGDDEQDTEEVTARVARVSFVSGDARIRRSGSDEWENVTLNLPVVEGDEIATEAGARIELQLAKDQHVRLAENSSLKLVTYSDEGIALSLSLGTMHLRIRTFNKDRTFFEIDAPKTTMALQSAGSYRIDAGNVGDKEIKIAAITGEIRVYTENAGFTLKGGRRARLYFDGPTQGEWETGDAMASMDEFDRWGTDRDEAIALRLGAAYYDKYYDDDIYGADDLYDNGQWIHTRDYGYVWRPFSSAIRPYSDWSPYRYGHWRWLPPFGWTWVNDEPWGWATYHYGRWFYHNGYWNWSPYGYYRSTRSWWRPALVAITVVRNNICWYPLTYHQARVNFNRQYHRRNNNGRNNQNAGPVLPVRGTGGRISIERVPAVGVVGVDSKDFGKRGREIRRLPREVAETVIAAKTIDDAPQLPKREELGKDLGRDILAERPTRDIAAAQARVGTVKRTREQPLDKELRTTLITGGRPLRQAPATDISGPDTRPGVTESRPTGIFDRPAPTRVRPKIGTPMESEGPAPNARTPVEPQRQPSPTENVVRQREPSPTRETPRRELPPESARPTRDPPTVRESPRRETPPASEKPRDSTPRVKETPKSDPAPAKESPKPERRPDAQSKKADPIT
ncbi:hypothetical protein BH20ACI2_BH20ACI2_20310 [soil metagenome]